MSTQPRCKCTVDIIESGYKDPDSDCKMCGGSGFLSLHIDGGANAEEVYIGICSLCGYENGIYLRYIGMGRPTDKDRSLCLNENCSNSHCSWVLSSDIKR